LEVGLPDATAETIDRRELHKSYTCRHSPPPLFRNGDIASRDARGLRTAELI
jgi:hypothetical protein